MNRRHALGILLAGLLASSALATSILAILCCVTADEVERWQARADAMNRTSNLMQQLATESLEYGRQNPSINALLAQLNIRPAAPHPDYALPAPSNSPPATPKRP